MKKISKVTIPLFIIFFFSIFIISSLAQECKVIVGPTHPGESKYNQVHPPLIFDPANPDEIIAGQPIEIKVLDGIGPFIWKDPGNGYTWLGGDIVDPDKPKIRKTTERKNTLQCASGT